MIVEGDYAHAVDALSVLTETNIPEMQNADFVGGLLQKAQDEGNTFQAHRIAQRVAEFEKNDELKQLFKSPTPENKFNTGWVARERTLYEKEIQDALNKVKNAPEADWDTYDQISMAHTSWNFREDGFYSENPHPLAIDTARAFCQVLNKMGMKDRAYQVAVSSKLPQADLEMYEATLPKMDQLRIRLHRHFAELSNKTQ